MKFEKLKKVKAPRPLYLLSYRTSSKERWIETIPMYDRSVTRRNESFYISRYGEDNVQVEVIDKTGRRIRAEKVERSEYDGYEE